MSNKGANSNLQNATCIPLKKYCVFWIRDRETIVMTYTTQGSNFSSQTCVGRASNGEVLLKQRTMGINGGLTSKMGLQTNKAFCVRKQSLFMAKSPVENAKAR